MDSPTVETKAEPKAATTDEKKLQAMMGGAKQQEAKYVLNTKGERKTLGEDHHKPQATLYFKGCDDCEYIVDAMCTKVYIEGCKSIKVTLNNKIITNVVEIWKCEDISLNVNTNVGTLQTDMCNKLVVDVKAADLLKSFVWTAINELSLSFQDFEDKLQTSWAAMKQQYPNITEHSDQFITRFVKGKLLTEKIIRLDNGYPTTEREKKEFDDRQEENLQKLAQQVGITIGKKKPTGPKIGPNDPCTCGNGKKYKKCHGKP